MSNNSYDIKLFCYVTMTKTYIKYIMLQALTHIRYFTNRNTKTLSCCKSAILFGGLEPILFVSINNEAFAGVFNRVRFSIGFLWDSFYSHYN